MIVFHLTPVLKGESIESFNNSFIATLFQTSYRMYPYTEEDAFGSDTF